MEIAPQIASQYKSSPEASLDYSNNYSYDNHTTSKSVCPNCGNSVHSDELFCSHCGESIK